MVGLNRLPAIMADEILRVLELDSVKQTLRLFGAPVEPIFYMHTETLVLRIKMYLHSLSIVYTSTLSTANTYTITNPMRRL